MIFNKTGEVNKSQSQTVKSSDFWWWQWRPLKLYFFFLAKIKHLSFFILFCLKFQLFRFAFKVTSWFSNQGFGFKLSIHIGNRIKHHYSDIKSFRFIKLYKSYHFMFFPDQILVNFHWELNLKLAYKKNKCKSKNWLDLYVI